MFNGTCTATGAAARLSLSSMSIGLFNIHNEFLSLSLARSLPSALKSQVLSEARNNATRHYDAER